MSAEPTLNGSSSASDGLTPAQKLMEKHGADEAHKVTIEDVVDEEDIQHPPPSASVTTSSSAQPSNIPTPSEPLSEKAAGKQKEAETPSSRPAPAPKNVPLDTQSEELFPALGAPKSRAAAAPTPWSRKPATVGKANGTANGFSNGAPGKTSSGTSTPVSGVATPGSTAPSMKLPGQMSLPGRYSERIQFAPSQLTPRNQLKKPATDVLRDINKRSKATVQMLPGPGGLVVFEATGQTSDTVRSALKEVANQLGSKQSVKIPVPLSVRPHIIGRQGATVQAIGKRTGARIQIPKGDDTEAGAEDDDSATIDVLIEGDAVAAEMARREIEAIVNERTSTVNMRLKDIPAEYYPFLSGPHNAGISALEQGRDVRVQIPQYHTWMEREPAQSPAPMQPAPFTPQAGLPIHIAGDRLAAAEARAQIERQVEQLRRQLATNQLAIERGRHQFIMGEKGAALQEFLADTGCAVILPPDSEDSEMLTIIGPADRLEDAESKLIDLASSMAMSSVDIARQHPNAPQGAQAHARNVTRYLQQRRAIEQLERMYDARIVAQTSADSSTAWQVYSRDNKNAMRARSDIMNLISGIPPTRLSPMNVDPFFHQHLRQQAAQQVRDQYGVHVVVPEDLDTEPEILLVYEGPSSVADYQLPRRQPSQAEAQGFAQALQQAQNHIASLLGDQSDIISRDVDAPGKFHDKIRRHVERQQQGLPSGQFPAQVSMNGPRSQPGRKTPPITVRGPSNAVDALYESLLAFIEQEKQDELERGFTLSFDFPQKFANMLIGKKGENIKKLREEFDVDIQVNDGKVEIKGPEAKANACKAHILAMGKKLEDEATFVLKVAPQFHRDLIGARGSQVNRLQDRYNVKVNFPRSAQHADDESPAADGEAAPRRNNQAPDEVVIRGPKRGAEEAREEILNLLQYTMDHSHTATVSVAQSQLPSLIGAGGREMDALRLRTGAQIDVPGARDAPDPSGRAEIKLKGNKKQVEEAKKALEEAAKTFDATVTRTVDVEKKHHRAIIGAGGSNLRDIVVKAGGPDDRRELARMVRFPRADADGNTIRVEGPQDVVDKIIASIEGLANKRENETTQIVEVAPEKHRQLIGRGGETRRNLESQFNVAIDIPKQTVTGPARSQVKVAGQPEDVEKAKEHILTLIKDQEGATVVVPLKFHHAIADNGQFFRRLRNDHKVTVDHAGQRPPPRQQASSGRRVNGGALPLITDESDASADNFSWELQDLHADAPEGEIPWILSGPSAEEVEKARSKLEAALEQASKQDSTGFLILPDPRAYRLVIGPGGSEINRIRKKTGTKINVPRDQSKGEAIEITGSKGGVEEAKDIIMEIVKGQGQA